MADDNNIVSLIRERALAAGVDPDVLTRIARIESNLDPNAQPRINPNTGTRPSTATGLFQFVNPTWQRFGQGDPRDPYANADAGARFTAQNIAGLRQAGIEPTPDATYLAHFAGLGGATKVLSSPPSARVADLLDPTAIRANPFLANMTAGDLRAWAARKMQAVPAASGSQVAPGLTGGAPTASGPSQTGAVPVAPENAAGQDDELLRVLQTLSTPGQEPSSMPAPPPLRLEMAQPARIRQARALAAAMGRRPI